MSNINNFDPQPGNLYYDADGQGGSNAQIFAQLAQHTTLTATDIHVV